MHPTANPRHPGKDMKRRNQCVSPGILLLLCGLLAAGSAHAIIVPLTGGGQKGVYHKQIERLERQWGMAVLAGDNATMASMLADSYVGIGPSGTIASKGEELGARASGQEHLEKLDVEDRNIRIYGTTAVVTSKVRIEGMYSGQPVLGEYRYTRVWSLERGQWRIVSFEANRVHDSTARRR
jgi:ketosteroid isomerase-like protein